MITREVRTPLAQALFGEKLVPEATKNYMISCTSFKSVFGPSVGVQDGGRVFLDNYDGESNRF